MRAAAALLGLLLVSGCAHKMTATGCRDMPEAKAGESARPAVSDDGYNTTLTFEGHQRGTAITVLGADGEERAVDTTPDPVSGAVVVHGVWQAIVLRDGKSEACLWNNAYDRKGIGRL